MLPGEIGGPGLPFTPGLEGLAGLKGKWGRCCLVKLMTLFGDWPRVLYFALYIDFTLFCMVLSAVL